MKKTQLALAAVALVASSAALADVQVYGNADASIISGGGVTTIDGGGGYTTSLFGLRGSEDLGGGLKASFNFESAVNLGDGSRGGGAGGNPNLFNRAANVGLGNETVGITVGNIFSPVVGAAFTGATAGAGDNVNVTAVTRLLPNPASINYTGGAAAAGFFIPNAVSVRASAAGITANYITRVQDNDADNSGYSGISLSGSVDTFNWAVGQQASTGYAAASGAAAEYKTVFAAANTKIGDLGLNGAWSNHTGINVSKNYMVGASYPLSEAASIGAIYARSPSATNQTSVNLKYSLSKATVAYVTYSTFSAPTANNTNTNNAGITASNVTSLGISHSF